MFLSDYISRQQPRPDWTALILPENLLSDDVIVSTSPAILTDTTDLDTDTGEPGEAEDGDTAPRIPPPTQPSPRGGHQLVIDCLRGNIYLFGGWDGSRDLADFWQFNIAAGKWSLVSGDTAAEGGPGPRSCHKMVLDPTHGQIFVLGRYLERSARDTQANTRSDFYVFDIGAGKWTQITDDTSAMGGPALIFDHQMCLDPEKRDIYVFGGQTLFVQAPAPGSDERPVAAPGDKKFSGLFVYHIPDNTWRLLCDDGEAKVQGQSPLRSRTGHSMLFNTADRNLYIFGGQRRRDEYLNDFFRYNVDTGAVVFLSDGAGLSDSIPAVGYTQRATIDCKRNEIYVMTGLNKDKVNPDFLLRHIHCNVQVKIYKIAMTQFSLQIAAQCIDPFFDDYLYLFVVEDEEVKTASLGTYLISRFQFSIVQGKDIRTGAGEGGQVSNSFWVYEVGRGRWSVVYRNENSEADYWQRRQTREPRPRYAHQLVYHEEAGTHFMFGGNPGGKVSSGSLTSSRRCSVIRITVPQQNHNFLLDSRKTAMESCGWATSGSWSCGGSRTRTWSGSW